MYKTLLKITTILSIAIITGCANYTSVREHSEFSSAAKDIESVIVVPPQVHVELKVFTGENESLIDKERYIKRNLVDIAQNKLRNEGLKVIDFSFEDAIKEDEEFAFAITQCRNALDEAKKDLYSGGAVTIENKRNFQASLGPVVNFIAEHTGADSVLMMDYYGFEKSNGMVAKDMAAGILLAVLLGSTNAQIAAPEGSALDIALVETRSGNVLWANRKSGQSLDASLANHALQELPDMTWQPETAQHSVEGNNPLASQ